MGLTIVEAPAAQPVTLAEAKSHIRISHSAHDDLINVLIASAAEYVESNTGRQLVAATYNLAMREFPAWTYGNLCALILVPRPPLIEVEWVKYRDSEGALQTLVADTDYYVDTSAEPGTIEPVTAWPVTGNYPDAVQVRFRCGYSDSGASPTDLADNVPSRAKVAIKALVSHWHEFTEPVASGSRSRPVEVPHHVTRLLRTLRIRDT